MIRLVSVSHYLHSVTDSEALPALGAELKLLCREPFRRIDRFIELALLGSARCAAGQGLSADCAVYLGSGLGPIGNNIVIQQQMIRDQTLPKPFNFINTLGASAGFHIARNLGLSGRNFFISRRGASMAAALSMAFADLASGDVRQALVGSVEEVVLPLAEHRLRQGVPPDTLLAEGSHWLLLQSGEDTGRSVHYERFERFDVLMASIRSSWHEGDRLRCMNGTQPEYAQRLNQEFPDTVTDMNTATHDDPDAIWLARCLMTGDSSSLFLAGGDEESGWSLFHFRA